MSGMSSSAIGAFRQLHALGHRIPVGARCGGRLVLHVLGRMAGGADGLGLSVARQRAELEHHVIGRQFDAFRRGQRHRAGAQCGNGESEGRQRGHNVVAFHARPLQTAMTLTDSTTLRM